MKTIFVILFVLLVNYANAQVNSQFERNQLAHEKVKEARAEKEPMLRELFDSKGLAYPPQALFFRTFKQDNIFEMWAKNTKDSQFVLVKSYEVCYMSGELGPKRKRGDRQVPEGFYVADYYNPNSWFLFAVRVNYPNASDWKLTTAKDPGGDICIHGACASIGCISITDELIKEVYLLMVYAKGRGQANIPVHIFPTKMTEENWNTLKEKYKDNKAKIAFWENIREGYLLFEKNKTLPKVTVDTKGKYVFK